jgi:hypothetical protein
MEKHTSAINGTLVQAEGFYEALWSIEDISYFMKRSKGYVYGLVSSPGFPAPVTHGERYRRWSPSCVKDFLTQPQPVTPIERIARQITINYEPQCSQPTIRGNHYAKK